jgi:hypothetical protein
MMVVGVGDAAMYGLGAKVAGKQSVGGETGTGPLNDFPPFLDLLPFLVFLLEAFLDVSPHNFLEPPFGVLTLLAMGTLTLLAFVSFTLFFL